MYRFCSCCVLKEATIEVVSGVMGRWLCDTCYMIEQMSNNTDLLPSYPNNEPWWFAELNSIDRIRCKELFAQYLAALAEITKYKAGAADITGTGETMKDKDRDLMGSSNECINTYVKLDFEQRARAVKLEAHVSDDEYATAAEIIYLRDELTRVTDRVTAMLHGGDCK